MRLQSLAERSRTEVARSKAEDAKNEEDALQEANRTRLSLQECESTIRTKREQQTQLTQEAARVRISLERLRGSETDTPTALQSRIAELENQISSRGDDQRIVTLQRELGDVRSQLADAQRIVRELQAMEKTRASLRIRRDDLSKAEGEMRELMVIHRPLLEEILVGPLNPATVEQDITLKLRAIKQQISLQSHQLEEKTKGLSEIEGRIDTRTRDIARLESLLADAQMRVVGHENLPDEIAKMEERVGKKRDELQRTEVSVIFYTKYIDIARAQCQCPLCERGFTKDQLGSFVEMAQHKIDQAPQFRQKAQEALAKMEEKRDALRALRPAFEDTLRLGQEIPQAKTELQTLTTRKTKITSEIAEMRGALSQARAIEERLDRALQEARRICTLSLSLERLRVQVEEEQRKVDAVGRLGPRGSDDSLSVEDAQAGADRLESRARQLSAEIETIRIENSRMKSQLRDLQGALKQALQSASTLETLQRQAAERDEVLARTQSELAEAERQRISVRQRVSDAEKAHHEASQRRREAESVYQDKLDRLHKEVVQMEALITSAGSGPGADGEPQREQTELTRIEAAIGDIAVEIKMKSEELERKRQTLMDQNSIERNILDNMAYRKKMAEVRGQEALIKDLQDARGRIPGAETCLARLDSLAREISASREKHASLTGRFKLLRKQLLEKTAQINPAVEEDHRQALIKLKTTEIARRDLVKYHQALEKALMKFHSAKMAEVNQFVRDIWQETYQGHDIDYIEIRSDVENDAKASTSTTTRRRSYSYRVVMVKDKVELDMRGRCSAGQKELASLVIRLALAETFCLRCGILALDEPTANLDRANVESFASTIIRLITALKRHQDHFQLIVITHDEEFVQHLAQGKFCQYYWRVSKDDKTGSSKLERQEMVSLG